MKGLRRFQSFFGPKFLFTAVTLGFGFEGGVVTPLFFIGATLANALSGVLALPSSLLAAKGLVEFGTGFPACPMRFRVNRLKIDQSFVREVTVDPDSDALTSAVIALGRGLNIAVIAEGVETAAHRDLFLSKGCEDAQGYFNAKPVTIDNLQNVIDTIEQRKLSRTPVGALTTG